jgi:hypothetical protein
MKYSINNFFEVSYLFTIHAIQTQVQEQEIGKAKDLSALLHNTCDINNDMK